MFKEVVKLLFPRSDAEQQPNYFYFEEDKISAEALQQQAIDKLHSANQVKPLSLVSAEEAHQQSYYDFLFGQSPAAVQHDELSRYVADKVAVLLQNPNGILNVMPVLPASLNKVMAHLCDDDFDTALLLDLIQQEPSIAAKVIELANSSFYNHSNKAITDLKSAFMLLGSNGLIEGVINGFISKLTPQSQIYFKQYGRKIWQHSLACGVISKELIKASVYKSAAAQGYLIGLICNLGDMVIYQLLMDAFAYVHPDCQPNSYAFKELMQQKSKKLTYHIAKHWYFPQSILEALTVQVKITNSAMLLAAFSKHPMACYVYEANIISELMMMFEFNNKSQEEVGKTATELLYSVEAKLYIERLLIERASN
ncbi:MAG: HDOD domain-containing protein [Colwellia sp.]|nr:HDOD domain-containing protein [Colwellia sp.]